MTDATIVPFDESLPAWEQAFYAFLAEKERRSGSRRTVDAYSGMQQPDQGCLDASARAAGRLRAFGH